GDGGRERAAGVQPATAVRLAGSAGGASVGHRCAPCNDADAAPARLTAPGPTATCGRPDSYFLLNIAFSRFITDGGRTKWLKMSLFLSTTLPLSSNRMAT